MKYFLIIIFSFFCLSTFSQNVIKEYWENGNLKFERKYPKKDTVYVTNPETGIDNIKVFIGFDSLYFYTKQGVQIDIDEFVRLNGENETNTKAEKLSALKKKRDDSIAKVKENKKLDKLVLKTHKKRKVFLDTSEIELKYFYGEGDVCGYKIDGTKFIRYGNYDYQSGIKVINGNSVFDIVQYVFYMNNKKKGEGTLCQNKGNYLSEVMKYLFSKIEPDEINNYELIFKDIYLKDKDNNYFKLNEFRNFKLFCDK